MRAFSSVAQSRARKGILLALRMVSSREVAVMIWEEPAVREVYKYSIESAVDAMLADSRSYTWRTRQHRNAVN